MVNEEHGPAIVKEVAPDKSGKYDGVQFHKTYEVLLSAGHPAINHSVTEGSTEEAHLSCTIPSGIQDAAHRASWPVSCARLTRSVGEHNKGRASLTHLYAPRLA